MTPPLAGPRLNVPVQHRAGGIRRKVSRWFLLGKKTSGKTAAGTEAADPYALRPDAAEQTLALVTLLGVETGRAAQMVRAAQDRLTQFDRLVFVLSAPDLVDATRGGAVVELLPGPLELAGHTPGAIRRYLEARQDQILQKWQPDLVLHYGMPSEDFTTALIARIQDNEANPF